MTLKELLSACCVSNEQLHISVRSKNNIITELTYISEYMEFCDCEVDDITIMDNSMYITVKEPDTEENE